MDPLQVAAVSALCFLALAVLLLLKSDDRRRLLSFLVGLSGGLVAAQIAQVHIFTIIVLVWALNSRRTASSWTPREVVIPVVSAGMLASTVLYGDLTNSPSLALQLLALTASGSLIVVCGSQRSVTDMLYGLLAITSVASFWGLLQVAGVAPIETWHVDVSAIGRPIGIYPEPDWLGMYAGIGLVLAWRLHLRRNLRIILIALNASAWVLAFARAAWIAVAASTALAVVVGMLIRFHRIRQQKRSGERPDRKVGGRGAAVLLVSSAGLIAFETIPELHDNIITRLSRTFTVQAEDISARARVQQNDGLFFLAETAPWHGWGLSASGRVGVSGVLTLTEKANNNVGSNWAFSMWVDGAWLALPLIATLGLSALFALRTIQAQLLVLTLLSSFFSNATFQPITWLLLGCCLWHALARREERKDVLGSKSRHPMGIRSARASELHH